jgi:hypothetical protein
MAGHHAPGIYFKTLLFLAMLPAFYQFLLILISCKYIYPMYRGKAYKIDATGIPKFVFAARG